MMEVLRRWDPIGVINEDNQDEYDGYSVRFVQMLDADAPLDDLMAFMRWIVCENMGMSYFNEARSRSCAEEMINFWRTWKGK